jgi:hypothetical protein
MIQMKLLQLFTFLLIFPFLLSAQTDTLSNVYQNTADQMLANKSKLNIGGYGEVHYNQPLNKDKKDLGTLDVHRMVLFFGYNFSSKTQFVTEIEVEYAKEVWVEQAFLQHKLNSWANFKAGLLLVPMGIINEYHEPTTFNGVERPVIDNKLGLSTWREVGAGFSGTILPASLKYQLYVTGGLNGYDTKAIFNGSAGLREGRQKGSKAYVNSPAFSGKVEYFGIKNLNVGLSGYLGKSQSKLYSNLDDDNSTGLAKADSSVVGISMVGADARYNLKGLELRGQIYLASISNTEEYNVFTKSGQKNNDLGSKMTGYYVEAGYNVLQEVAKTKMELVPFIRYEFYNMHQSVEGPVVVNDAYKSTVITGGLTCRLTKNAVLKTDLQWTKPASTGEWSKVLNAGIGVMF